MASRDFDGAVDFFEFAMDRGIPEWVPMNRSLTRLHLGPGRKFLPETVELDWPTWDADTEPLPYPDDSIGGIVCTHFLEHLVDPRRLLREASRVLASGCPMNIMVPLAGSRMFEQDLDHKSAFNLDTWRNLLDQPYYTKERDGFSLIVGVNVVMAIKHGNEALLTQLIKR